MSDKYEITIPDAKASKTLEGKLTIVAVMVFGACIVTTGGFALAGKENPAFIMGAISLIAGLAAGISTKALSDSRGQVKSTKMQTETAKALSKSADEKKSTTD